MISVGFSTQKWSIVSTIVRWVTGAKVSHAWLLIEDPLFGAPLVMEAAEVGVRLTPFPTFKAQNNIVDIVEPKVSLGAGLQASVKWLGDAYDFAGLFGMAWVYLGRALHKRWKNPLHESGAMFCSEFVVRVLQAANYPGAEDLTPDSVSPEDLLAFVG